jgi:hypothetical protein
MQKEKLQAQQDKMKAMSRRCLDVENLFISILTGGHKGVPGFELRTRTQNYF